MIGLSIIFFCYLGCKEGFWGRNCSHKCNCQHDSICDQFNGQCKCTKGYTGDRCELECPSDRYGLNCAEPCRCNNGGKCHHISGECTCAAGFTGPLCTDLCPMGTHGEACKSKCKCQNDGVCNPQTGKCQCPKGLICFFFFRFPQLILISFSNECSFAGWTGEVCANRCPSGFYGMLTHIFDKF